jgi:hypothetical protein
MHHAIVALRWIKSLGYGYCHFICLAIFFQYIDGNARIHETDAAYLVSVFERLDQHTRLITN